MKDKSFEKELPDLKEKLLKITDFYGLRGQQKKLAEEIFELQEAIKDYEVFLERYSSFLVPDIYYASQSLKTHIEEELADVMVVLEQFKLHYGLSDENIENFFQKKIDRQLKIIAGDSNE